MVIEKIKVLDMLGGLDVAAEQNEEIVNSKDVSFIILLEHHKSFKGDAPSYLASILGKPILSYVKNACKISPKMVELDENQNMVEAIHPYLSNSEWTVVLHSDTPLITRKAVEEALSYAISRELNVCKLMRGYVFKTEYVKRVDRVFDVESYEQNEEYYIAIKSEKDLAKATSIMKQRIVDFLLNGGVQIVDPVSTYIESGVKIKKGSVIYPNVSIMGDTTIGEKSIVGFGSIIKNSVIGDRCNIQNSYITNSVVLDSSLVESSRVEVNSLIEKNCVIKHYSIISSAKIGANSKVSWSKVKGIQIEENSKIES